MSRAWIAFYMGDYLKKTKDLTVEQHGAYLLLLIECWSKGSIPVHSETKMAQICSMSPRRFRRKVTPILAQYFNADGTNNRATEEVIKAENLQRVRKLAGIKGGVMSAYSKRSKGQANVQANGKQTFQANVNQSHKKDITSSLPSAARETAAVENKRPPTKEVEASKPVLPPGTPVDAAMLSRLNSKRA